MNKLLHSALLPGIAALAGDDGAAAVRLLSQGAQEAEPDARLFWLACARGQLLCEEAEAARLLEQAIGYDSGMWEYWAGLAASRRLSGDGRGATVAAERAYSINPHAPASVVGHVHQLRVSGDGWK